MGVDLNCADGEICCRTSVKFRNCTTLGLVEDKTIESKWNSDVRFLINEQLTIAISHKEISEGC